MKKKILVSVLAGALCLGVGGVLLTGPAEVYVARVRYGDLIVKERCVGRVAPAKSWVVASKTSGMVEEVFVQAGEDLPAGTVLYRLDDALLREEIAQVSASLQKLESEGDGPREEVLQVSADMGEMAAAAFRAADMIALAQNGGVEYGLLNEAIDRARSCGVLLANALPAQTEKDNERQARVEELEEALTGLEAEKEGLQQRSELGGQVVALHIREGQTVAAGDPIATMAQTGGFSVEVRSGTVRKSAGQEARVIQNGITWKARLVGSEDGALQVRPEAGFSGNFGDTVDVDIYLQEARDVCLLPADCIGEDGKGEYALVAESGRLVRRDLVVSLRDEATVAITEGIGTGEQAVFQPEKYKEGQRIKPIDWE